ncbi:hypothetical protein JTB14_008179 [Gonioctena quinquepunctata]|nr:hypothetical protein JTB14_008179 [Gonioctena quinquepunctata]
MAENNDYDKVKKLPELIENYLGSEKSYSGSKISRLTGPGENYGSVMLKVDIQVVDKKSGREETLHAVAKILPEVKELRELFQVDETVVLEMNFYQEVVPTLQHFQRSLGVTDVINCFCECIAVRKTLQENCDIIDDDSVILLENLVAAGFRNVERLEGFDLDTAKLILKDLAQFHGVPLALKMKEPKVFADKIKRNCVGILPGEDDDNTILKEVMIAILKQKGDCCPKAIELISRKKTKSPSIEPFATMIHNDLWVNNTMQKFFNVKAVANKMVDFQLYGYGSPATDLFFFLWTSIPQNILETNLDNLLQYYHECFVHVLEQHGCDATPFTYEWLMAEMKLAAENEYPHSFFFNILVLFAKKGVAPDFENVPTVEKIVGDIALEAKDKVWFMTKECEKRGWF